MLRKIAGLVVGLLLVLPTAAFADHLDIGGDTVASGEAVGEREIDPVQDEEAFELYLGQRMGSDETAAPAKPDLLAN